MIPTQKSVFLIPPVSKVIVFGGIMCDIYLNCAKETLTQLSSDTHPECLTLEEGSKTDLSSINYTIGGGGANVACSLAHLGLSTTLFAKVGSDHLGNFALNTLRQKQIDLSLCVTSKTIETGTSLILPSEKGNHAILVFRGANASVQEEELPLSVLKTFKGVYIASLAEFFANFLPQITVQAKASGSLVMHNPSKSEISNSKEAFLKALPYIDILIMNRAEATLLFTTLVSSTTPFSHTHLYEYLAKKGPHTIIITAGHDGAYCVTPQEIIHQQSIPTTVVNTVGAGDIFGSTFFGAVILGYSYKDALLFAAHNSAHALAMANQETRLLTLKELIALSKS